MRKSFTLKYLLPLMILSLLFNNLNAQVTMTTTGSYFQDFNTLINTGTVTFTDNSTLANWYAKKSATGALSLLTGTGSSNAGGLYSFGATNATDRALGTVGSGTPGNFAYGVLLKNTSGTIITDVKVTYTMEQWRNGGNTTAQPLTFYFQKSASAITDLQPNVNAAWTQVPGLTISSPVNTATAAALDGNVSANRVTVTGVSIPGLSLANNEYIMLKWDDPDNAGNDHGLSIDDVTITWTVTPVISSNADLSVLSINAGAVAITPSFTSAGLSYAASVSNAINAINLSFTKADANSTVEARINGGAYGSPLSTLPLNVGANTIDVRVTAQDGITVKTYSVTVTRAAPATPILSVTSSLAAFGNVCTGLTTAANSFTLSGTDLDVTAISITALTGFSFAESATGPFSSSLSFSGGSSFSGKLIFVKFSPTNAQSYDGNIIVSGGGVAGISVPVSATGINTPASVNTGSNLVAGTAATLNGTLTSNGCSAVTSYGFEYSTVSGFANGTQVVSTNLSGTAYSKTVSGLTGGTTYFYKAFAVNNAGTAYGTQQSFTTSNVVPVVMSQQPLLRYSENFSDITNWSNNFITGVGANRFSSVAVNATGTIPDGIKTTVSSASFPSSTTSTGVFRGTGNIVMLATGGANSENSNAVAFEFYMDFTGVNAGTLSFDWAEINNGTGNRNGSLRVYASVDGISFTEISSAAVLNLTNNVPATGTVSSIVLPSFFNNSPSARLRFYYYNGSGPNASLTGSRPKISIDNLTVTAIPSTPCVTPAAGPTSLTFNNITETSVQGNFLAASPAVNEYIVVMSTNSSLTSLPIDGQTYFVGDNIGDGTVIDKGSDLSFSASGLTGATTYYFFVFPVNSVCTGGPLYLITNPLTDDATTVAGLPNCSAPASQATNLVIIASINTIQGSFTATAADEYLVLQSSSPSFSGTLVNGISYSTGAVVGNATVIQKSGNTSFTASGLNPATQYYYYIVSINSQACLNGPVYNTVSPLIGSQTTLPLPLCVTPDAQPYSISFNASNNSVTATFNAAATGFNYLVVMSSSPSLTSLPVDNTDYAVGNSLGGGTVVSNNTSTSFIANNLSNSTTYYFFVFSANKNCTGGTKYLVTSPLTGNATTTNAPVNNYYFGNLHAHSDYSDGNKDHPGYTPGDDYNYAVGAMDFLGISEHNHFSSLDNPGNELANYHLGVSQAAAFNAIPANKSLLALYGMEWGVISGGGHVVVYGDGLSDLFGWESNVNGKIGPNYDVYVPKSTYTGPDGLFKTVNDYASKNAFATLAHPNNTDFNNLSNVPYDSVADDAISGVAVESGPATSTNTTFSNPGSSMFYLWYYQKLLAKGYHLGPTIDHDNHNTTFGRTTTARTAVIAPTLSQSDLIKAVKDMHFYATEDIDAKVDFTINTRIMGSIFEDRNAPSISVNLTDATTSTSNALIRVMFGIPGSGILPVVIDSVFGSSLSYVDNSLANHATGYYYIDITNGSSRIVTSPIWYTRICASNADLTITACNNYTWAGTTYTTSTTATKVFTTTGGCDSTVVLHLTINNSPASATISLVGSDTGCPGAGVAFTATADATNGAISSYEWMKDGITAATTAAGNFTALASGAYSVKAINENNCSVISNSINATVVDNTAPVANVSVLPVLTGECGVTVIATPTATDNCTGLITAQTPDALSYTIQGTYTITWTYNDGNGNTSSQTQTVIVKDITAPVLSGVPANAAVSCDNIPAPATVNATDNCDASPVITYAEQSTQNADVQSVGHYQYTITRTWTATDVNGNSSSASQIITVNDSKAPVITAPANIIQSNDDGQCSAVVTYSASANDNCSPVTISYSIASGTAFPVGVSTVTVTALDVSGNSSSVDFTVTVNDTEKPAIKAPYLVSVPNDAGQCGAVITNIGTPLTNDNCGVASVSNDHPSSFYPVGTTIVTWTVTDIHGNVTDTAKQKVRVIDNELPTISVTNISVNNDAGTCGANIILTTPVTNDNCGVASITNDHPSVFFPVGVTNVIWTVTDNNGWTKTAVQIITVTDTELPTITVTNISVNNNPGICGANITLAIPVTNDNCGVASVTNDHPSTLFPVGTTSVIWTVTDTHGLTKTAVQTVSVLDKTAPVINAVAPQAFCFNTSGNYSIPVLTASDNCSGILSISYSVSGATTKAVVTGNNASGIFNTGVSTINWTVADAAGNSSTSSTQVTVYALPSAAITVSNADAFCNKLTLTASTLGANPQYNWMYGNATVFNTQTISLGQNNADGIYQLYVSSNGCTGAAASYTFSKQTLASSYTIIGLNDIELGENNTVASGSVGVIAANGEASFRRNSSVASAGSFVKAKKISKDGANVIIANPIYSPASGITLPTMLLNTANTNGLPNKDVTANSTVTGNYKNLTIKKGIKATLTGNTFGVIRVEQGAQVTFTSSILNIDKFQVVKGPRIGYSYIRFAPDTKVLVSGSVTIGSQVYINPDNYKVTFYLGDLKSDDEVFSVKGGDTKVTANVYITNGKLKVTGGYSYGDYGNGKGDSDKDDDEDKYYGQGNSNVYMTGLFIADEVSGEGKNVIWNNFDCNATPVPVMNGLPITQSVISPEKEVTTTEEDLKVTVLPNPSSSLFTLKIESRYSTPVNLRVMDSRGRVVDAKSQIGANSTIQIGQNYAGGTYYAELIQGGKRRVVQLVKLRG